MSGSEEAKRNLKMLINQGVKLPLLNPGKNNCRESEKVNAIDTALDSFIS